MRIWQAAEGKGLVKSADFVLTFTSTGRDDAVPVSVLSHRHIQRQHRSLPPGAGPDDRTFAETTDGYRS